MNFNASFQATLNFERPAEICQFEWGYWPETLDRWHAEGLAGEPWEALPITWYYRPPVYPRIFPLFEEVLL